MYTQYVQVVSWHTLYCTTWSMTYTQYIVFGVHILYRFISWRTQYYTRYVQVISSRTQYHRVYTLCTSCMLSYTVLYTLHTGCIVTCTVLACTARPASWSSYNMWYGTLGRRPSPWETAIFMEVIQTVLAAPWRYPGSTCLSESTSLCLPHPYTPHNLKLPSPNLNTTTNIYPTLLPHILAYTLQTVYNIATSIRSLDVIYKKILMWV